MDPAWTAPAVAKIYDLSACPLPTPEDRLLFLLVYLKQNTIQTLHGCLFGMRQSKVSQWIHVFPPVLCNTLRPLGDVPAAAASKNGI